MNGSLPTPSTENDLRTLGVHIEDNYHQHSFWLSFTDVWREGTFVEEYRTVKFNLDRLWAPKQPDNRKKADHFVLATRKSTGHPYQLYDVDNRQKYLSVCEITRERVTGKFLFMTHYNVIVIHEVPYLILKSFLDCRWRHPNHRVARGAWYENVADKVLTFGGIFEAWRLESKLSRAKKVHLF